MTRRHFVTFAHWATTFLLADFLMKGPDVSLRKMAGIAGLTGIWFANYAIERGLLEKPDPKLVGVLRLNYRLQYHALYSARAAGALASVTVLEASAKGHVLIVLLYFGFLHGVFHLWRDTAVFDCRSQSIPLNFTNEDC